MKAGIVRKMMFGQSAVLKSVQALFAGGSPGVNFQTYNPNDLLTRKNFLTFTEFPNGLTDLATATGGLVTATTLTGFSGAIAIGRDGVSNQVAYKDMGTTPVFTGAPCVISVVVQMDDGLAPVFSSAAGANVANDFNLVVGGSNLTPTTYVVQSLGSNRYRVSAPFTGSSTTGSYGIIKWSTNSTRTFKTTAWQFDANATVASAYQKVTDWNTEYLAAVREAVNMWQDQTTPVTAVEQSVGLWLDTSKSKSLSAELITTAADRDLSSDTGFWTKDAGVTISGGSANWAATAAVFQLYRLSFVAALKMYEVTYRVSSYTQGGVRVVVGTANGVTRNAVGTYTERLFSTSTTLAFQSIGTSTTLSIDDISIKEVQGSHAWQATAGSRPKLSARYNLLTKTEQFDDTAWTSGGIGVTVTANAIANPVTGELTADMISETAVTNDHRVGQAIVVLATGYRFSIYAKAGTNRYMSLFSTNFNNFGAVFDLQTGLVGSTTASTTASMTAVGGGWYLCSWTATFTTATTTTFFVASSSGPGTISGQYAGSASNNFYVWGVDLRTTGDAALAIPKYQRVNTATDYDTAGFIHYIKFDGTDDSLQTPNIDFSGVNKVAVWASVTKLSEAAAGVVLELGATSALSSFALFAPDATSSNRYYWRSAGASATVDLAAAGTAPTTDTIVGQGETSTPSSIVRRNGVNITSSSAAQGGGNYSNAALNIGRRNNASIPFNGRITNLTVRGSTTAISTKFLRGMEQYAARLAGQTFVST